MLSTTMLDGKQGHLCLDVRWPRRSCVGRLAHRILVGSNGRPGSAAGRAADRPLQPVVRPAWTNSRVTGLDYGWRAFRNRSESETQPSNTSALKSEASWLLRGNPS